MPVYDAAEGLPWMGSDASFLFRTEHTETEGGEWTGGRRGPCWFLPPFLLLVAATRVLYPLATSLAASLV